MLGPTDHQLSRRQRQIMGILHRLERATAAQVHEALPDAPSYTAVRTLLTILEREGHVHHIQEGRHYVYFPAQARQNAAQSAVRQLVQTFFGGSLERAVTTMLSEAETDLTDEELERLTAVIERAKEGERRDGNRGDA